MKQDLISFIFARGGSKGIKNKNIVDLDGKPLIAHSILHAKKSKRISTVVVSTDDQKIAEISESYGAQILERPQYLALDDSPEIEAWQHAIKSYKKYFDKDLPFISLPTTSPLRDINKLDSALDLYLSNKFDLVLGVSKSSRNPYLNMAKVSLENKNEIQMIMKEDFFRRQDVPEVFDITTNFYIGNANYILCSESVTQGKIGFIEVTRQEAIDIDDNFDLHLTKLLFRDSYEQ